MRVRLSEISLAQVHVRQSTPLSCVAACVCMVIDACHGIASYRATKRKLKEMSRVLRHD